MDEPTPVELYDMIADELARTRPTWRTWFKRRSIRLPVQGPTMEGRTWMGVPEKDCWRYTPRQARQMRRALAKVFRVRAQHMNKILDEIESY